MPSRTPPVGVVRALAEEVGFGCPVEGCGSPYLTWHHFDPPWALEQHHRPEGMIALCRDHHPEADAGAFTKGQLHELKARGRDRNLPLGARFNWMHDKLLAVVGGNFFYDVPIAVRIQDTPVVWFNRDSENRLLVNLNGMTTSDQPRIQMRDNFWLTEGTHERQVTCPPSGRLVRAEYENGDLLSVEFHHVPDIATLDKKFPPPSLPADVIERLEVMGVEPRKVTSHADAAARAGIEFPIACGEIEMIVAGTDLAFAREATSIATNTFAGGWMSGGKVGFQIGQPSSQPGPHPSPG